MTNMNKWNAVFTIKFYNAVIDNPEKYPWYDGNQNTLISMCDKLKSAIYIGNNAYAITDTIKATCKELGIKASYKSINQYLNN
jgi:hypothetical protein